jgi:exonuclease SbcC
MRIELQNFKCWYNKDLKLSDSGIILLDGKSGRGKSSILDAIFFCLYGDGNKLVSHGKNSCSVTIEFEDYLVTRSKKPNHLSLSCEKGIFEDDVAQSIINEYFGTYFDVVSYVKQNGFNTFLKMTPTEKLEFLEKAVFHNTNLSLLKQKSRDYIKECNEKLIACTSKLQTLREMISQLPIPESVSFPFKVPKADYDKVTKNESIKKRNSEILLKRVNNEISSLTNQINHLQILNDSHISKSKKIIDYKLELNNLVKNFINNFKGDDYLGKYQKYYNIIQNRKKYQNLLEKIKEEEKLFQELKESELLETKKRLEFLQNETNEIDISSLEENISNYKTFINDITRLKSFIKSRDNITVNSEDFENLQTKLEKSQKELEELQKVLDTLKKSKDIYPCPHCRKSVHFSNGQLLPSSHLIVNDIDKEIIKISNSIKKISKIIEEDNSLLSDEIKKIEKVKQINEQIFEIYSSYEDLESMNLDETILELTNNLESETELIRTNKKNLEEIKRLKYILAEQKLSKTLESMQIRIDGYQKQLKIYETEVIDEIPSDLTEEIIQTEIEIQKDEKDKFNNFKNKEKTLNNFIKNYEDEITKEKNSFLEKYSINEYPDILELENNINQKKTELQNIKEKLDKAIKSLDQIDKYNNYISAKNNYDSILQKINDSEILEKEYRGDLAGATSLKEKISEAESLALSNFIESLNVHVNLHLEAFFKDDPMMVQIETFKENRNPKNPSKPQINIKIDYKGMDIDVNSLSGGERDRLDLGFTLALSELFGSKILLLDECISSLDYDNSNNVLEGIRENYKGKLVIVISHQANEGAFDEIIHLQ